MPVIIFVCVCVSLYCITHSLYILTVATEKTTLTCVVIFVSLFFFLVSCATVMDEDEDLERAMLTISPSKPERQSGSYIVITQNGHVSVTAFCLTCFECIVFLFLVCNQVQRQKQDLHQRRLYQWSHQRQVLRCRM